MFHRLLTRNEADAGLAGHFVDRRLDPLNCDAVKVLARFDQPLVGLERDDALRELRHCTAEIIAERLPAFALARIIFIRAGSRPMQVP